jgi:hypothetical protein
MTSVNFERMQYPHVETKFVGVRANFADDEYGEYGEWLVLPKNHMRWLRLKLKLV